VVAGGSPDSLDITVRRCTVRVRRRDGWAWGDPEWYLDQVRTAIESALGQAAADAGIPTGVDAVLTEPVALTVGSDGTVHLADRQALTDRLRAAVQVDTEPPPDGVEPTPEPSTGHSTPDETADARGRVLDEGLVGAALGAWSRAGRLAVVVSGWTAVARLSWLRALHETVGATAGEPLDDQTVARIAEAVMTRSTPAATPDVRALVLAGAVIAATGDRLPDRRTLRTILRTARLDPAVAATDVPTGPEAASVAARGQHTPTGSPSGEASPAAATTWSGPFVVPALPFLVVVQLGRLGYLEAATTALAVSGLAQPDAVLAGMLAGKVLEPPAHGWLRTPAERDAVRLVSGLDDEDLDAEVDAWEPGADDALAPLASVLVGLYAADRSRFADVVVTRTPDEGTVVGEADGRLPIGWTEGSAGLADVLAQLGHPPVVESDLFAELVERLAPRRALPGLTADGLERHLGAAVGTGLGSLAQDLWGGPADAVLALDRLGDLEALVEVTDRLTIGIPRGQRWLDLKRAGLVDAWPAPWAPGGLWELVTW
jgi:hypothetical protein